MKLQINTTAEQDEALANLNALSNPKEQPSLEEFAASLILSTFDGFVTQKKQSEVDAVKTKLQAVISRLTPDDLIQVLAVADKYAQ